MTMDAREQRGLEIAARARIVKRGEHWIVPSQTLEGTYKVTMAADGPHCTCPDFELRGTRCKHGYAVEIVIQRETVTETTRSGASQTTVTETAAVRLTYPQNWPAYNKAQAQEKALFCHLLHDLAAGVPEPVQVMGRPRIPMADAIFCAGFKVYSTVSGRRFMTDVRNAHAAGLVARSWHFNTILKVIEDAALTPTLYSLVSASAAPLRSVESVFAVDSTGFGTQCFYRHFSSRYGHDEYSRDYVKLHALIGTNTNVIAAASVTAKDVNDTTQFGRLVESGAEAFTMRTIVADKGYSGRGNADIAARVGAEPFFPMKVNAVEVSPTRGTTPAWSKLFHLYSYHREEFAATYHARSNAESTFSAMKRVFGDTLRSKTPAAQTNELLFKVIAHNIVCVVHSIFELGVQVPGLKPGTAA
jgi:transposase